MIQKFDRFKRNVAYPLVATMLLYTGCVSSSTSRTLKDVSPAPHRDVTFVDKTPETIDEISSAMEGDKEIVYYMKKFNEIKIKVGFDKNYDPQRDIRNLHSAVKRSGLKESSNLTKVLEDFGFYKDVEISRRRGIDSKQIKELYTSGGILLGLIYAFTHENNEGGPELGLGFLVTASVMTLGMGLDKLFGVNTKKYSRRTFVNAYSGRERKVR